MERSVSLSHEEAEALLEMSLLTYADDDNEAARSALGKLGELCRELSLDRSDAEKEQAARRLACR